MMVMTPAQLHIHIEVELSAGHFPIVIVGHPGVQGADIAGMQGCGVNTPIAADVAAATWGFTRLVHIPKGSIFTMGLLSKITAVGLLIIFTRLVGRTWKVEGVSPKEHLNVAPRTTICGIYKPILSFILKLIRFVRYSRLCIS
jgi:hypothetical protein